jgi:hypothetical protein
MKPCPFCGHEVDLEDGDTLYPNGTGWREEEDNMRVYCSRREVPKKQWCWSMHCPTTAGGCGVEMSADSREEAIQKWNKRA